VRPTTLRYLADSRAAASREDIVDQILIWRSIPSTCIGKRESYLCGDKRNRQSENHERKKISRESNGATISISVDWIRARASERATRISLSSLFSSLSLSRSVCFYQYVYRTWKVQSAFVDLSRALNLLMSGFSARSRAKAFRIESACDRLSSRSKCSLLQQMHANL